MAGFGKKRFFSKGQPGGFYWVISCIVFLQGFYVNGSLVKLKQIWLMKTFLVELFSVGLDCVFDCNRETSAL